MSQIESDQRWGLGVIPGAQYKGGWGPALDGKYLVRQIGVIPTPGGMTAVAMTVQPESGALVSTAPAHSRIANWLNDHMDALPGAHCS